MGQLVYFFLILDTVQFWSAGNSYTTGNTTERSSLYSWGDDVSLGYL